MERGSAICETNVTQIGFTYPPQGGGSDKEHSNETVLHFSETSNDAEEVHDCVYLSPADRNIPRNPPQCEASLS